MAGSGPPPREKRRRNNPDTYADVKAVLSDDGEVRGPDLPGADLYVPQVRDWYETWRRSPQAATFVNTDWQRLHFLAPLVNRYFLNPHHLVMAEIRHSESLLGATYTDRLKSRMKIEKTDDKPTVAPAGVAAIDSYRKKIAG